MSDAEFDFELRRMFFGFGGAVAFMILLYALRAIRIYMFGKRVQAEITEVITIAPDPLISRSKPRYSYILAYTDRQGAAQTLRERQETPIQEYKVGDRVTAFVEKESVAEILSWRRLLFSTTILLLVATAMWTSYYFLLESKKS